jgi:hypothetical protein
MLEYDYLFSVRYINGSQEYHVITANNTVNAYNKLFKLVDVDSIQTITTVEKESYLYSNS